MRVIDNLGLTPARNIGRRFQQEAENISFAEWMACSANSQRVKFNLALVGCIAAFILLPLAEIALFNAWSTHLIIALVVVIIALCSLALLWMLPSVLRFACGTLRINKLLQESYNYDDVADFVLEYFPQLCMLDEIFLNKICCFNMEELEQTLTYARNALAVISEKGRSRQTVSKNKKDIIFTSGEGNKELHRVLPISHVMQKFAILEEELILEDRGCTLVIPSNGRLKA